MILATAQFTERTTEAPQRSDDLPGNTESVSHRAGTQNLGSDSQAPPQPHSRSKCRQAPAKEGSCPMEEGVRQRSLESLWPERAHSGSSWGQTKGGHTHQATSWEVIPCVSAPDLLYNGRDVHNTFPWVSMATRNHLAPQSQLTRCSACCGQQLCQVVKNNRCLPFETQFVLQSSLMGQR